MIEQAESGSHPGRLQVTLCKKLKMPPFDKMQLAYESTLVISDKSGLKHLSPQGRKISEQKVANVADFIMLSEEKVLILSVNSRDKFYALICWDLREATRADFEHPTNFYDDFHVEMLIFRNTGTLCICQSQAHILFKVTYFRLPLAEEPPIHSSPTLKNPSPKPLLKIKKLNETSMVGFIPNQFPIEEKDIYFYTYHLPMNPNLGLNINHNFNLNIDLNFNLNIDLNLDPNYNHLHNHDDHDAYEQQDQLVQRRFEQWLHYGVKKNGRIYLLDLVEVAPGRFYLLIKVVYYDCSLAWFNVLWHSSTGHVQLGQSPIQSQHRIQFINNIRELDSAQTKTISNVKAQRTITNNAPIFYIQLPSSFQSPQSPQSPLSPESSCFSCNNILSTHPLKNKIKQTISWPVFSTLQILQYHRDNEGEREREETEIEVLEMPACWCIYWEGFGIVAAFFMEAIVAEADMGLMEQVVAMVLQ